MSRKVEVHENDPFKQDTSRSENIIILCHIRKESGAPMRTKTKRASLYVQAYIISALVQYFAAS